MEREQKIYFGYRGNGVSVWTECGNKPEPDYTAHIQPSRKITYYQDNAPDYFKKAVEEFAESNNLIFSNGSDECGCFALNPLNKPTKYCDTKFYGRILLCEEYHDGKKVLCTTDGHIADWSRIKDYDVSSNRKVYFVCDFKYGANFPIAYAWSFGRDVAESSLAEIQHRHVDIDSDFRVIEKDEQYLIGLGEMAGANLDYNNE